MAVTEQYAKTKDASAPFRELLAITPLDATTYDPPLRGLIVSVAGNVIVETERGAGSVTIAAIQGQVIDAMITVVNTATTSVVIGGR